MVVLADFDNDPIGIFCPDRIVVYAAAIAVWVRARARP